MTVSRKVRQADAPERALRSPAFAREEWADYSSPDWDGDGAEPITQETVNAATLIAPLLRGDPDSGPGADGTIGFQWNLSGGGIVVLEVGPGFHFSLRYLPPPDRGQP